MNIKKFLMIIGASAIILFSGWFYIGKLGSPEPIFKEKITAAQIENTELSNAQPDEETKSALTRIDSQGAVGVEATLLPEKSSSNELIFEIVMNTHSVDLLQYPLNELTHLSFGTAANTSGEFEWERASEDSHHMVGYLKWKGEVIEESITLEIKDIDNVSLRTFTWENDDLIEIN